MTFIGLKPYLPYILLGSALVLFIWCYVNEKNLASKHPLFLDMAANYIINVIFVVVIAAILT